MSIESPGRTAPRLGPPPPSPNARLGPPPPSPDARLGPPPDARSRASPARIMSFKKSVGQFLAASAVRLEERLRKHVQSFSKGVRQGTGPWLDLKSEIVGGSELSVIMGMNPYSTWESLVAKKIGLAERSPPGVACHWGTMFEPVSERFVELDCKTSVFGTDIHMHPKETFPDHGNSPDGYCVIHLEDGPDGWDLSHDPAAAIAAGRTVHPVPTLVELKAPYRRYLDGRVPKLYRPQVWSGLGLSPVAHLGLYVEIVYRLCTLPDLGPSPHYSMSYHQKDFKESTKRDKLLWEGAFAWGVTAVYAPRPGTRASRAKQGAGVSDEDDMDMVGLRVLAAHLGFRPESTDLGRQIVDLGQVASESPRDFDRLMKGIDSKNLLTRHSDPVFSQESPNLSEFMSAAEAPNLIDNYYLFGYLPWKVMQADYHLMLPRPDFLEEIREPVSKFMSDVRRLRAAPNVGKAYFEYCVERQAKAKKPKKESVSDRQRDELFAFVAAT
jgi:hypothetical protein